MIIEEEFPISQKPISIFESLLPQKNSLIEMEEDVSITYSGSKETEITSKIKNILIQSESNKNIDFNSILNLKDQNDDNESNDEIYEKNQNNLFSIKYKDIYIGGISPNFQMREGFGLNKYNKEHAFYFGQWKNNMKEGIGFLKINDDTFYIGYFHQNQLDGDCILYLKSKDILYLGRMSNGAFDEGVYLDINKEVYYRGKFINGRKNDNNCTMLEMNNRHIFVGKVENDIFQKGYICLYNYEEITNKDENGEDVSDIQFDLKNIFYFFRDKDDNNQFLNQFENEFKEVLHQNIKKLCYIEYETKNQIQYILQYFEYLNTLENDEDFNNLIKYNDKDDSSLFYIFKKNYEFYLNGYQEINEKFNINEIKNEIDISQEIQGNQDE